MTVIFHLPNLITKVRSEQKLAQLAVYQELAGGWKGAIWEFGVSTVTRWTELPDFAKGTRTAFRERPCHPT